MAILETQINGKYPKNAKRRQPTENQLKNSNTLEFGRFQRFSRKKHRNPRGFAWEFLWYGKHY